MASLEDLKVELVDVDLSIVKIQKQVEKLLEKQEKFHVRKNQLELEISKREKSSFSGARNQEASWSSEDFPWSENLRHVLRDTFGIEELRTMQLEAINATMSNRDVILIMPTGGGKSLCYQAPAMLSSGITLVVSPLISLIEDQIISLLNVGVKASKLNSSSSKEEVKTVHGDMVSKNPTLKLLYVTPEKISKSKRFMAQLEKCYKAGNLCRVAIDEVHCASQWGNDFRPDYKILGILKRQFPDAPLLGLTATSTDKVTLDTKKMLSAPFAMVLKTPLNRSNLYYHVRRKPDTQVGVVNEVVAIINSSFRKASGIIYCFSCKDCEDVSAALSKHGVVAAAYHARLESDQRTRIHKLWLENKVHVICATVAFGMGINKPDVKFVIHFSLSKSVENYYQESGRAGRDGQPALCLLYYGFSDIFRQSTMVLTEQTGLENLDKMLEYCQNVALCRRVIIFSHFGEDWNPALCNESCDVCCSKRDYQSEDVTDLCSELLRITQGASSVNERLTGAKLLDAANGRGKHKTTNQILKSMSNENVQRLIVFMLRNQYLKEDFHFTPYSTISYLVPGQRSKMLTVEPARISLVESAQSEKEFMACYDKFCEDRNFPCGDVTAKRPCSAVTAINSTAKRKKIGFEKSVEDRSSSGISSIKSNVIGKSVACMKRHSQFVTIISDSDDSA